jgi:hypothetical protein
MTNCLCISIPFLCFICGKCVDGSGSILVSDACTSFDRIRCLASMGDSYMGTCSLVHARAFNSFCLILGLIYGSITSHMDLF